MKETIKFIGLDVHKNSISIALADEERNSKVRYYGKISNTLTALDKFVRKQLINGCELKFIYEAGPCGYSIYRHLTGNGFECVVAAPSLIP